MRRIFIVGDRTCCWVPLDSLKNFVLLASLELNHNNFSGSIPAEILTLGLLDVLYVNDNPLLQGGITSEYQQLVSLRRLRLGRTDMGGPLPAEFFTLQELRDFQIPQASFEGVLNDADWLNLSRLEKVDLSFNNFSGPIPQIFDDLPNLGTCETWFEGTCVTVVHRNSRLLTRSFHVGEVRLQGNAFSGSLTNDICAARGDGLNEIKVLVLPGSVSCPNCCDYCETVESCEERGLMG